MTSPVPERNEGVARKVLLATALVAGFFGAVAVAGWSETPTFERLGPWLASLSAPGRAAVGLLVGACAAAPSAVRMFPRVWRWAGWPAGLWLLNAAIHLMTVWLPPRGAGLYGGSEQALFRDQAGWYIVTSLLAFFGTLSWIHVAVMVRAIRRVRDAESAVLAQGAQRLRAGSARSGRALWIPTTGGRGSATLRPWLRGCSG